MDIPEPGAALVTLHFATSVPRAEILISVSLPWQQHYVLLISVILFFKNKKIYYNLIIMGVTAFYCFSMILSVEYK